MKPPHYVGIGAAVALIISFLLHQFTGSAATTPTTDPTGVAPTTGTTTATTAASATTTAPVPTTPAVPAGTATTTSTACDPRTGDGINDFCACESDGKTTGCVAYAAQHASESSYKLQLTGCLTRHDPAQGGTETPTVSAACSSSQTRRQALNADEARYCVAVATAGGAGNPQPGSAPLDDWLNAHHAELTDPCLSAATAHECAKPYGTVYDLAWCVK